MKRALLAIVFAGLGQAAGMQAVQAQSELAEIGRRTRKHCAAQFDEPPLQSWIGESDIYLLVELFDNLCRGVTRAPTP